MFRDLFFVIKVVFATRFPLDPSPSSSNRVNSLVGVGVLQPFRGWIPEQNSWKIANRSIDQIGDVRVPKCASDPDIQQSLTRISISGICLPLRTAVLCDTNHSPVVGVTIFKWRVLFILINDSLFSLNYKRCQLNRISNLHFRFYFNFNDWNAFFFFDFYWFWRKLRNKTFNLKSE